MHHPYRAQLIVLGILFSMTSCSEDTVIVNSDSCLTGELRCEDNAVMICEHGIWEIQKECESGCNAKGTDCKGVSVPSEGCKEGETLCSDDIEMSCTDGAWEQTKACSKGCDAAGDKCRDENQEPVEPEKCTDGDMRELEEGMFVCENGVWKPCDSCDDVECAHDGVLCMDDMLVTCHDGQVTAQQACIYGCADDGKACAVPVQVPDCKADERKCEKDVLYICQDGVWKQDSVCSMGCQSDGQSCAACQEGDSKCSDGTLQTCTDGAWHSTPCPYGCGQDNKTCELLNQMQPTRYIEGAGLHSPITPYVVEQMRKIAAKNTSRKTNVFMKVGDSHYDKEYDGRFMLCFSDDTSNKVTLDGRTELESVIQAFQSGTDSFNRDSYAAVGGSSTRNLFQVSPDNISREINDISPRFAFFGHGCNDMGNGCYAHEAKDCNGYAWAVQDYYRQVNKAMDTMINAGVIPLISAIAPRNDAPQKVSYMSGAVNIPSTSDYPKYMSNTFNAVARGNAEARQLPYFDTFNAFVNLPDRGISSDDLHASHSGSPCDFSANGLQYGVNTRNLGSIQLLNRAWQVIGNDQEAPDRVTEPFSGSGSSADPYIISSLPYTHSGDTSQSPNQNIASYPGCSTAKEGGGEYIYKMVLNTDKRLRMFAVSAKDVDVDIQIMRDKIDGNACIARDDIMLHGTFKAGTYYIAVDTYSGSTAQPGLYLLGIVECDAEDAYCDTIY